MSVQGYLWRDAEKLLFQNPMAKVMNLNFGLDEYDVCIENKAQVLKNGKVVSLQETPAFVSENFSMYVTIFPFRKNQVLSEQFHFLSKRNQSIIPPNIDKDLNKSQEDNIYYSYTIKADQGKRACSPLSLSDEGFFYQIPGFNGIPASISFPPPENEDDYLKGATLVRDQDKYEVQWNGSRFFLSTKSTTLWINRGLFVLAWAGLYLLLSNMKKKLLTEPLKN